MNSLTIVAIAIVVLVAGYALYGRRLAKTWGLDPNAQTPAYTHEDVEDYIPTPKSRCIFPSVFIHRRCRSCYRTDHRRNVWMAASSSLAVDRWYLLRSRSGFYSSLRFCKERRKIHGCPD